MKKIILSLILITLTFTSFAVKRTVSNNLNSPGQYTSLSAAITASNANDTLYVVGSPTDYGSITIDKRLTIIGSGYRPNKQIPDKTIISSISIVRNSLADASNTKIIGISFNSIYAVSQSTLNQISGIEITRCEGGIVMFNVTTVASMLIYNNKFTSFGPNTTGVTPTFLATYNIYNNIITGAVNLAYSFNGTLNLYNNLFLSNGANAFQSGLLQHANVYNNVFYGTSPTLFSSNNYNSFHNNLSYAATSNTFGIGGTNTGANNLENVNPLFVSSVSTAFSYTADYTLGSGSPALTAGSGSTQIGIYGGLYPYPVGGLSGSGFQTSLAPNIPQIYEMNMQNPLVPTTGTLNVQIKARKVD